jgi:hypothetical protein
MNLSLHEMGPKHRDVLRRVHDALKPGGTVVVSELPLPDSVQAYRDDLMYKLMATMQLPVALFGSAIIPQGELSKSLTDTYFTHVHVADLPPYLGRIMVLAEKGPDNHIEGSSIERYSHGA